MSLGRVLHWAGELLLASGIGMAARDVGITRRSQTTLPGWQGVLAVRLRVAWNRFADLRVARALHVRPIRRVQSMSASMTTSFNVDARMRVDWVAPRPGATDAARLKWLEDHVTVAGQRLNAVENRLLDETRDRVVAMAEEQRVREAEISELREELAHRASDSVRLQAWSVTCLLAGTVLTAFF
jgi:hypothetical protein